MSAPEPAIVVATYRLADPAHESAFVALLRRHWPTLRELGFVEPEPARLLRRVDDRGRISFVEIFRWRPGAAARAHEHPDVADLWGPMQALCGPHDGLPPMDFPHYEPLGA